MHEPTHTPATHVAHEIDPVYDSRSRVLLLGTMPSPKSRETGFFYGHPQNRFWRVLAALFDEPVPHTIDEKRDVLLRHGIALWDVLASCEIEGASDASIRDARPNDLSRIFEAADIRGVFATGAKAGELYRKLIEPQLGMPCTVLPSTSPANAKMKLADLVDAYSKALLPLVDVPAKRVLSVPNVARLEAEIAARGTSLSALMERAGRALAHAASAEAARGEANAAPSAQGNLPGKVRQSGAGAKGSIADAATPSAKTAFADEGENHSIKARGSRRVAVLCGSGNNGGDGWVAARELVCAGFTVDLVTNYDAQALTAEPAREQAIVTEAYANEPKRSDCALNIHVSPSNEELEQLLSAANVIVDAILGTGFSGDAVRAPYDAWIRLANAQRSRGARIVAADVPSGLSAQTGKAAEPCMKAHKTVTMITSKPGLETPYAFAFCGDAQVAHIAYVDPILETWQQQQTDNAPAHSTAEIAKAATASDAPATNQRFGQNENGATAIQPRHTNTATPKGSHSLEHDPFRRAETEDDDGYDPYSDRPPAPEPLFEADPWS